MRINSSLASYYLLRTFATARYHTFVYRNHDAHGSLDSRRTEPEVNKLDSRDKQTKSRRTADWAEAEINVGNGTKIRNNDRGANFATSAFNSTTATV